MSTTDDTRQRSVAELMGWERQPDGWYSMSINADGFECFRPGPPTCDDMAAWLHDPTGDRHGWCVAAIEPPHETHEWIVLMAPSGDDEHHVECGGLNIHEAFERAVWAVTSET